MRTVAAHAAAATSDTIVDYNFQPATINIKVGDTVTWTNTGVQPHTATANDGSFDTGKLSKGQSASHVFSKAGTFAYICSIHPYMKGTVVVAAASSAAGGSGAGSGSGSSAGSGSGNGSSNSTSTTGGTGTGTTTSTGTTNSSSSNSGSSLPVTGLDLIGTVAIGALLLGAGLVIRRRSSAG